MALGPLLNVSSVHLIVPLCAALGLLLMLCGMCTLCKKRRKRSMRNICPSGVALVDVSLLRQTQLRSLSKSDTKLHEIQRPQPGAPNLRPVSMDPGYLSSRWQRPPAPSDNDATYSNLSFPAKTPQSTLYESVGSRAELRVLTDLKPENETAEYACVRKVKKGGVQGGQEHEEGILAPLPSTDPYPESRPEGRRVEDMYAKVHKKKRPVGNKQDIEGTTGSCQPSSEGTLSHPHLQTPECSPPTLSITDQCRPPWRELAAQPEENLYESICEMNTGAQKKDGGVISVL
ncbi:lck-interacting transmembrane adapter 1 isoform 2-T2 [Discoglossus pictus]